MNLTKPQKLIYDMEKFAGGAISNICGSMLFKNTYSVSKVEFAINEMFRLNDALRIQITEKDGEVFQNVTEYTKREFEVLRFNDKRELDSYGEQFAKEPIGMSGSLCDVKIVKVKEQTGLLCKLHHLIGDAWALSLIGTQINMLLGGETPEVYSYLDYPESEEKYCQSKRFNKDREYFEQQFKKCDEVTYLNEAQADTFNAERKTFIINKNKTAELLKYTEKRETSVFTLLLMALSAYINRVKMNADKFYIGTAVLNRNSAKEKNTMGMYINTVPVLIELDNDKSFSDNLVYVQDSSFAVLRHQKYNYGDVLDDLRKNFGFSEKLYDVMLSYQNAQILGGDVETQWHHCGMQTESLQIHVDDRDSEGVLRIHYDYLSEKFTEHEMEMLHDHLFNLLFDAITDDSRKIYELEILTDNEKQKLLCDFNDTKVDYPKDKCIHQLFEEQVERTPDKVAVVACDKTLTYRELNEEANKVAHSLMAKGIGAGDIVAVILPRDSHLIPSLFGVLKTGAAYMPLDTSYPKDRIDYLIGESGSRYVIDESNIKDYISNTNIENPDIKVLPKNLFCALHTSGSTGRPKVTALTQQNLLNFLFPNKDFWEDVDTVICVTIATFDIFMQDTLLSATLGKKIILASNEQIYNQPEFEKMFESEENVMFFSTPTKLMSYIKQSKTADFLKKIRSLIVAGEVFTDELYDLITEKMGDKVLRNIYGPTETSIFASQSVIDNGYEPTKTTLGVVFNSEDISTPPQKKSMKEHSIVMDHAKQRLCAQKPLRIFNAYGPTETYIASTETALIGR